MKNLLLWKGDINGARDILDEARRLGKIDEVEYILNFMSYFIEMMAGNYQSAQNALDNVETKELLNNQFNYSPSALLRAYLERMRGNETTAKKYFDSARVFLEQKQKSNPEDERLYSSLGIVYAALGRKEEAVRAGMRGVELLPVEKEAWRGSFRLIDLAKIYMMTGDQEKAVDLLERLLSIPSELSAVYLKNDPSWIPLRTNKRFQKLVAG